MQLVYLYTIRLEASYLFNPVIRPRVRAYKGINSLRVHDKTKQSMDLSDYKVKKEATSAVLYNCLSQSRCWPVSSFPSLFSTVSIARGVKRLAPTRVHQIDTEIVLTSPNLTDHHYDAGRAGQYGGDVTETFRP